MGTILPIHTVKSLEFLMNQEKVWMQISMDYTRNSIIEMGISHAELNQFLSVLMQETKSESDFEEFMWRKQISDQEYIYGLELSLLPSNWTTIFNELFFSSENENPYFYEKRIA